MAPAHDGDGTACAGRVRAPLGGHVGIARGRRHRYDGKEVVADGTVVEFTEEDGAIERHLLIQDDAQNRVQLVPPETAEPYIGADVQVTGRYSSDPGAGRRIQIEEIAEQGEG